MATDSPNGPVSDRVTVPHPQGQYDVLLGRGLIDHIDLHTPLSSAGFRPASLHNGAATRALVVTDDVVAPLYAARLLDRLRTIGFAPRLFVFPAGERQKTLPTLSDIYTACVDAGLGRDSPLLALGGGVVGDIAGLAAATYLRGIPFVQIPTTLLAMADSSIGGKVAIDLEQGKNLVGAFKQPLQVVMDLDHLATLPARQLRAGLAEILKAAIIAGGPQFDRIGALCTALAPTASLPADRPLPLDAATTAAVHAVLRDALLCKRDIVAEDPFEQGRRALLNLGHTFGHALESWSQYTLLHGEAVALGLLCAAHLSHRVAAQPDAVDWTSRIHALLTAIGLPTTLPRTPQPTAADASEGDTAINPISDALLSYMGRDKKRAGPRLRFVLLHAPGDVYLHDAVDESDVRAALRPIL